MKKAIITIATVFVMAVSFNYGLAKNSIGYLAAKYEERRRK